MGYTMGKDMSSTMVGHDMSSTMMGSNMGKMMRQNKYQITPSWSETMMGNNVDKTVKSKTSPPMDNTQMGAPMLQAMWGHNMDNTMMGAPMVQTMLGHNNMDKNMMFNMFGFPMMGHPTYTNMMGRDMS